MTEPQLNAKALEAATRAVSTAGREMHTNESLGKERHIATRAVSAYLAADDEAKPELYAVVTKVTMPDNGHTYYEFADCTPSIDTLAEAKENFEFYASGYLNMDNPCELGIYRLERINP